MHYGLKAAAAYRADYHATHIKAAAADAASRQGLPFADSARRDATAALLTMRARIRDARSALRGSTCPVADKREIMRLLA